MPVREKVQAMQEARREDETFDVIEDHEIEAFLDGNVDLQYIKSWMDRDRNYQDKIERLTSPHTSLEEIESLINHMAPTKPKTDRDAFIANAPARKPFIERLFAANQSLAMFGDVEYAATFQDWLARPADANEIEKKLKSLKCHRALGYFITKLDLDIGPLETPHQVSLDTLVSLDKGFYAGFARVFAQMDLTPDGASDDQLQEVHQKFNEFLIDSREIKEGEQPFENVEQFKEAATQALSSGIWGTNQAVAALGMTNLEKKIKEVETFFPTSEVAPYRGEAMFPVTHEHLLGGIINAEQSSRYHEMAGLINEIRKMNFAEAQQYFKTLSIHDLINEIDSFKTEIEQAMEICERRDQFIAPLLDDFRGRDLDTVKNKTQHDRLLKSRDNIKQFAKLNVSQYRELKKLYVAFYVDLPNEPCLKKVLEDLEKTVYAQSPIRPTARLGLSTRVYKVHDVVKDDSESDEEFAARARSEIENIAGLPVPPDPASGSVLKIGHSSDASHYKFVEHQPVGSTRAFFCKATYEDPSSKAKVTDQGVFTVSRHGDGTYSYQLGDIDENLHRLKISTILEICWEARVSAKLAPGQEKIAGENRQPVYPFILTTDNLFDAAIFFRVLTEVYGLDEKNFVCNFPIAQIKNFLEQNPIDQLVLEAGAEETQKAWKSFANVEQRIDFAHQTASLFAKTAKEAVDRKDAVQTSYDEMRRRLAP